MTDSIGVRGNGTQKSEWCSCGRMILSLLQQGTSKKCDLCEKEHAKEFQEKFGIREVENDKH